MRRKCGTCEYFRKANMPNMGWCTHPKRAELHNLVLVRSAELACRNPWDDDLWKPAASPQDDPPPADVPAPRDQTPERGVAARASDPIVENPTDRVTDITVRPDAPATLAPRADRWNRARTARPVIRTETGESLDLGPSSLTSPDETGADDVVTGTAENRVSHDRQEFDRVEQRIAHNDDSEQGAVFVHAVTAPRTPEVRPEPRVSPQADRSSIPVCGPAPSRTVETNDYGAGATEPLPIEEIRRIERSLGSIPAVHGAAGPSPVKAPDQTSPNGTPSSQPVAHIDNASFEVSMREAHFETTHHAGRDEEPIDRIAWVASLPRCCGTCRDFRRSADGRTGVCTNPLAFADQRHAVVESDQLACRSSAGVWWVPADDVWLEQVDVSHHTRPTPHLDAALAGLQEGESGRETIRR